MIMICQLSSELKKSMCVSMCEEKELHLMTVNDCDMPIVIGIETEGVHVGVKGRTTFDDSN